MRSRRGHGARSVFQRAGDGKWLAVLEIGRDPATGKRVRRYRRDITGDLRPNTAASYERLARIHVVGRLGAVRLAQLTPGHVERACQAMLADGLAPATVAKAVQVLSLMLDLAVREGAVIANPVARAQLPRQTRSAVAVLSPAQVDRILAYAAGTTDAALWGTMALAGLRPG